MAFIIASILVVLVAMAMVFHGARIRRLPDRRHRSGRFFTLGAMLMVFVAVLLLLQRSGAQF